MTALISVPELIDPLLGDAKVTDICINGTQGVWFDRGKGMQPALPSGVLNGVACAEPLRGWVLEQLSRAGKTWDAKHPFVDATVELHHASFRLHVVFPPIAREGVLVSLRRLPGRPPQGGSLGRWSASPLAVRLREAIERGDSILVAGATGAGKTTLAGDLLGCVSGDERILILEDTPELAPGHPHAISLLSRPPNADGYGEVTLRTLLRQSLRMRPDRIVLGECRGPEVLDLLQALNTGHRGALATLHANSARDALRRVELLCVLASGGSLPLPAIRELLSVGVQWIAQVSRVGGDRRITELWRLEGREGDTILMRPVTA